MIDMTIKSEPTTAELILKYIIDRYDAEVAPNERQDILDEVEDIEDTGSEINIDGMGFFIIHDDKIWDIYVERVKQCVEDCYNLNFDDIPSFIHLEVDWEQTAINAHADGYGREFAGYDGEEELIRDVWVFRKY